MADTRGSLGDMSLRRKAFALTTFVVMLSLSGYSQQKNSVDTTESISSGTLGLDPEDSAS